MKVNLQEVQQLTAKLNAMLLKNESVLTYSDKEVIQQVNNIEHYLISNADYDASYGMRLLKDMVGKCSQKDVKELLESFLVGYDFKV